MTKKKVQPGKNNNQEKDAAGLTDNDSNISREEINLLDSAGEDEEERKLHDAELDSVDDDGEPLNEKSSSTAKSGGDLDVPGSEDDDDNEDIGEEDEENNSYSLGGERKD